MLNSAYGVMLPMRELLFPEASLKAGPRGAVVKLAPILPPMILKPRMCDATAGNMAKSKAILVNGPVATSHAVLGGQASKASLISRIALQ